MKNSKWIWAKNGGDPDEYADFISEFTYNGGKLTIEISADTDYAVYLNGTLAAFGQYPDYADFKIYDEIDISKFAVIGENRLLITAHHCGEEFATHISKPAGIIFELCEDGKSVLVSDEKILSRIDPYFVSHRCQRITPQLGFDFRCDMTATETPYSSSVLTEGLPDTVLPRPIEKLLLLDRVESRIVMSGSFVSGVGGRASDRMQSAFISFDTERKNYQVKNEKSDGVYFVVDLGSEQTGLCDIDIELDEECEIEIGWGEHLVDGRCRTSVRNFAVTIKGKKGRNSLLNPLRRFGGRYFQAFVYGKGAKLNYLGIRPTPYPIGEIPYSTGNILRDEIYKTCVNTLRHSMHEHYEDCPWREQALYTLDSRNQMLCGYYTFDKTDFAKASLELISHGMRPDGILSLNYPSGNVIAIPMFSLVYFIQMREYLEHTSDKEFLEEKYPMMESLLSTFLNKPKEMGLIENFYGEGGYWNFYEWSDTMSGRFNETERSLEVPLNAFLSLALESFAKISELLGKTEKARKYLAVKDEINEGIKAFFDPETKLFRSFLGRYEDTYSVLTNSLALLCGAADGLDNEVIVKILLDNGAADTGLNVVPNTLSMNCFRFDGLLRLDREKYAPMIIDEIDREYLKMLKNGATTFWETALGDRDFDDAGSLCHGWSALPAYYYHILLK